MEVKQLDKNTENYLSQLNWPGNVRQLENTCRWLTVMSPGKIIHMDDLSPELINSENTVTTGDDWESALKRWADHQLGFGESSLLEDALPKFELILIKAALNHTGGRKQDAAKLLGWGRNTLTCKSKELELSLED